MSKIIAPVPKDVVVDSRRNIIGTGLVVFFGEQGDDPIETAEDIYAKVDGVETSIGKFVEIKENGQFYYDDNPVSIFIKGSLNKYVSCGLYQKVGNKLSQIDYIASMAAFTAAQEQLIDVVQNIRSKAGYKRHFEKMKEAKNYQGYYLNQVVFISEVNEDPQLAGQFIIKSSDDNIVDSITNFNVANSSYVLQRITGAYPYKNVTQVTAKSINSIHKFMYHLKMAGNFRCTLVVDYDFTTENIDLTIFKKVIFNKFVPIFSGITAKEVSFLKSGIDKKTRIYVKIKDGFSIWENPRWYQLGKSQTSNWIIKNCRIEKASFSENNGLYVKNSYIGEFVGDNAFSKDYSSACLIIYGSNVTIKGSKLKYKFGKYNGTYESDPAKDSYVFSTSKISLDECILMPYTTKHRRLYYSIDTDIIYSYTSQEDKGCKVIAHNPQFISSSVSIIGGTISTQFGYISQLDGDTAICKTSAIVANFSNIYIHETFYDWTVDDFELISEDNIIVSGYTINNSVYLGIPFTYYNDDEYNKAEVGGLFFSSSSSRESNVVINSSYNFTSEFTRSGPKIHDLPIWENAIRQNSTNVIDGTALPGFLSVGKYPGDLDITYTPVPTD